MTWWPMSWTSVVHMEVDKVANEVADMVKISDSSLCFACGDV